MAENFSLITDKNIYYRGEKLTVFFQANPDANTIKWTHLNTETVRFSVQITLLAMIAPSAVQLSAPTFIHSAILFIDTSDNA